MDLQDREDRLALSLLAVQQGRVPLEDREGLVRREDRECPPVPTPPRRDPDTVG